MKNITDNLKMVSGCLAIIALTSFPLNAQKNKNENYCTLNSKIERADNSSKREKYSYSLSKGCRNYNKNIYHKSVMGKPVFMSRDARHYNKKVYANGANNRDSGISNQEKRYRRNYHPNR